MGDRGSGCGCCGDCTEFSVLHLLGNPIAREDTGDWVYAEDNGEESWTAKKTRHTDGFLTNFRVYALTAGVDYDELSTRFELVGEDGEAILVITMDWVSGYLADDGTVPAQFADILWANIVHVTVTSVQFDLNESFSMLTGSSQQQVALSLVDDTFMFAMNGPPYDRSIDSWPTYSTNISRTPAQVDCQGWGDHIWSGPFIKRVTPVHEAKVRPRYISVNNAEVFSVMNTNRATLKMPFTDNLFPRQPYDLSDLGTQKNTRQPLCDLPPMGCLVHKTEEYAWLRYKMEWTPALDNKFGGELTSLIEGQIESHVGSWLSADAWTFPDTFGAGGFTRNSFQDANIETRIHIQQTSFESSAWDVVLLVAVAGYDMYEEPNFPGLWSWRAITGSWEIVLDTFDRDAGEYPQNYTLPEHLPATIELNWDDAVRTPNIPGDEFNLQITLENDF